MRIGWKAAGAAAVAATAALAPAQAQTPQDIANLDRLSMQRLAQNPVAARPIPVVSQPAQVRPLARPWLCMSATPDTPVFTSPDFTSRIQGTTLPQVAASGEAVAGFAQVLHTNGRLGYVPVSEVRPFRSALAPGARCRVVGVKPGSNTPLFDIR